MGEFDNSPAGLHREAVRILRQGYEDSGARSTGFALTGLLGLCIEINSADERLERLDKRMLELDTAYGRVDHVLDDLRELRGKGAVKVDVETIVDRLTEALAIPAEE